MKRGKDRVWFFLVLYAQRVGVVNLKVKALIHALNYELAELWCLSTSPVQPVPIKFCMYVCVFRRAGGSSMAQESGLQLHRRWTFSSDGEIEVFKCGMIFANQSLPEGSNIVLICKEGAQLAVGWWGLGPQGQGAQSHSTQNEELSRFSDVNQGQPTVRSVIARQVHRN